MNPLLEGRIMDSLIYLTILLAAPVMAAAGLDLLLQVLRALREPGWFAAPVNKAATAPRPVAGNSIDGGSEVPVVSQGSWALVGVALAAIPLLFLGAFAPGAAVAATVALSPVLAAGVLGAVQAVLPALRGALATAEAVADSLMEGEPIYHGYCPQ